MSIWGSMNVKAVTHLTAGSLQGTLISTLKEVKPTTFLGVPRIWEKFQETIEGSVSRFSSFKKKMFHWAERVGLKTHLRQMLG